MKALIYVLIFFILSACNTSKQVSTTEATQVVDVSESESIYAQQVRKDSANIQRIDVDLQELKTNLRSLIEQVLRVESMSTVEREFSTEGVLVKEKVSTTNVTNESKKENTEFSTSFYKTEIHRLDSTVNLYMGNVLNLRASYDSLRVQQDTFAKMSQKVKSPLLAYVLFFVLGIVATIGIYFIYLRQRS
jgi:membrane-bound lytic murein transglycosylase